MSEGKTPDAPSQQAVTKIHEGVREGFMSHCLYTIDDGSSVLGSFGDSLLIHGAMQSSHIHSWQRLYEASHWVPSSGPALVPPCLPSPSRPLTWSLVCVYVCQVACVCVSVCVQGFEPYLVFPGWFPVSPAPPQPRVSHHSLNSAPLPAACSESL